MREIENAEVRALSRVGSGTDLARIWNGLLRLCDDLSAFAEVRALLPGTVILPGAKYCVMVSVAADIRKAKGS